MYVIVYYVVCFLNAIHVCFCINLSVVCTDELIHMTELHYCIICTLCVHVVVCNYFSVV